MSQAGSMDQLKNQILTISALKNDGNLFTIIQSFLLVCIIEQLFMCIPTIKNFIGRYVEHWFNNAKKNIVISNNIPITLTKQSSIIFSRNFKTNIPENELTDSIIEYISGLNNSKFVKYNKFFYVCHTDVIELDNKVNAVVKKTVFTTEGDIEQTEIEIFSYYYDLSELHKYVNKILETSRAKRHNKLGEKIYYFNEISAPLTLKTDGTFNYANSKATISFNLTEFNTSKTLSNIYGEGMEVVRKRIDFFNNNRDWYAKKGVPYTFGLLMHGNPGCGKTSLIKAIANVTKRHIINISLNKFTTKTQLKNLFFSDKITIDKPGGMTENLIIPIEKRLYVVEDIDCATDIVLDRNYVETETPNNIGKETPKTTSIEEIKIKDEEDYNNLKNKLKNKDKKIPHIISLFKDAYSISRMERNITLDNFNERHKIKRSKDINIGTPQEKTEYHDEFINSIPQDLEILLTYYDDLTVSNHWSIVKRLIDLLCQVYTNTKTKENNTDDSSISEQQMSKLYSNSEFIGDSADEKFMTANEAYNEVAKKEALNEDDNYCTLKNTQSQTDMLIIKEIRKLSPDNLLSHLGYFPITPLMKKFIHKAVTDYNTFSYFSALYSPRTVDSIKASTAISELKKIFLTASYGSKFKNVEEIETYIKTRDENVQQFLSKSIKNRQNPLLNENYAGSTLAHQFSEYATVEELLDEMINNKKKIDKKAIENSKNKESIKEKSLNDVFLQIKNEMKVSKPDPSGMDGMFNDVNQKKEEAKKLIDNLSSEEINLSFLLNILDGVLETPGRILIMSSNYPERLDKALIRPGRIDLMIEFTKCSDKTIKEMLSSFFEINPVVLSIHRFPEYQYTPAEVNQIMFQNIHDCDEAIRILLEKRV